MPGAFLADCVLEGTLTGAFFVGAFLPFLVALLFSGGPCSSSLELIVKLSLDELELDGVAAFRFSAFAGCLFFAAALARLASSLLFRQLFHCLHVFSMNCWRGGT